MTSGEIEMGLEQGWTPNMDLELDLELTTPTMSSSETEMGPEPDLEYNPTLDMEPCQSWPPPPTIAPEK